MITRSQRVNSKLTKLPMKTANNNITKTLSRVKIRRTIHFRRGVPSALSKRYSVTAVRNLGQSTTPRVVRRSLTPSTGLSRRVIHRIPIHPLRESVPSRSRPHHPHRPHHPIKPTTTENYPIASRTLTSGLA